MDQSVYGKSSSTVARLGVHVALAESMCMDFCRIIGTDKGLTRAEGINA